MPGLRWLLVFLAALVPREATAEEGANTPPSGAWCAPELQVLREGTCFYAPSAEAQKRNAGPKTLVLFLHALVGEGSSWQWEQQRLMVRTAESHGLHALLPRGRLGIGPGRDPKVRAWPTAKKFQDELEEELLAEWASARAEVEKRAGAFERVFVFGFSNGAYYATSLALRGKLEVDGFAVFAGGSGGKYSRILGAQTKARVPIFVAYGTKDPDHKNQRSLIRTLDELGWPHRSKGDRIGHTVSNAQIREALVFLRGSGADGGAD